MCCAYHFHRQQVVVTFFEAIFVPYYFMCGMSGVLFIYHYSIKCESVQEYNHDINYK